MSSLYRKIADLPFRLDECELGGLSLATSAGWTRETTIVRLRGAGCEGVGEDVTYSNDEQHGFRARSPLPLPATYTVESFSRAIDSLPLFDVPSEQSASQLYRRWALESAAVDLALRQSGNSLADVLERGLSPVAFVVSLGLGDPPDTTAFERVWSSAPGIGFKVDLAENWTEATVRSLADSGAVRTVDLKGQYRGVFSGSTPNVEQYRWVVDLLPDCWIEDPALEGDAGRVIETARERVAWDAILHAMADLEQLRFRPGAANIKPSRFGSWSELLRVYEYCEGRGIPMYGGGQFELGPGRQQIQYLASLFHPDAPNDVAPSEFNAADLAPNLPASPLPAPANVPGFASV